MADLLGELNNSPEMQKEFEKLVQELGGAAAEAADEVDPTTAAAAAAGAAAGLEGKTAGDAKNESKPDESFQDAIRRTMERMQTSSDTATNAAASSSQDDFLAQMLKEMEKGGLGGEGGDEDFSKMLMGMMEQLTNKEILYEPMKELDDKYPGWMEKNRDKTAKEDLARYDEQRQLVREIVARFEEKSYSDQNAKDREYIVERMQKVRHGKQTGQQHSLTSRLDASCRLAACRPCWRYECCTRGVGRIGCWLPYSMIPFLLLSDCIPALVAHRTACTLPLREVRQKRHMYAS